MLTQAIMNHGGRPIKEAQPLDTLYKRTFGREETPFNDHRARALLSSISIKRDGHTSS